MENLNNNSGLRDNHSRGDVADFLKAKIHDGSELSVVSAYFTIYAYDALKSSLDSISHLDFLFGEPRFINRLDPEKTQKKAFVIDSDGLELSNKLQQKRVARECAALVWEPAATILSSISSWTATATGPNSSSGSGKSGTTKSSLWT